MLAKLSTITTLYRKFTKNQVLTEGHLNEIVDYFDDQDRISRIGLSGVGIICGFQVSYSESAKNISITQGSGITTDGDLIHLYNSLPNGDKIIDFESKQYTHYKVHDNKKAAYKPYFYNGSDQLEIFELLTYEQQALDNVNTFPIQYLKDNTGLEVNDAVILLYIETYEKDSDLCVSLSCDNQGLEIIGNHKALLVSKTVAAQINSNDKFISSVNFSNLYYKLPDVISNRIVLQPEKFINYNEVKKEFTYGIFKNNVVNKLRDGFEILLNGLQMPVMLASVKKNLGELYSFDKKSVPPDFQYRYDLLNDLIDTYNEIKLLLSNMDGEFCCPDIKSFPKHLMLGEVLKTGPCFEYRHAFYKSPLLTGQNLSTCSDCLSFDQLNESGTEDTIPEFIVDPEGKEVKICYGKNTDLQQLYSLIKRSVQLLANYNVNHNIIKITPSFELGVLGKKAIPFYNNVGNHLIELWDYKKTAIAKQRDNRSYHDQFLNTKLPLEFIADHDFYRIEGHQGKNYKEALKTIQEIRRQNGLGFNVVVLAINAYEMQEVIENFTSYYLNKNHGYEHKAGVAPGGTFVMIYIEGEYSQYPYYYGSELSRRNSLAGDFESEAEDGEPVLLNPVIADFTLPYLCCDDNLISLTLPVNKICFDETTPYFLFHITPTGGFVKADIDEDLNGGVTKNQYGEFVFDPKLVSEELIGQPIAFTVNNFETKCEITIFRKPKFDFTIEITKSEESNEVTADFTITGENQDGMQYTWDFGDGSERVITNETKMQRVYKYELPVRDSFSFPVSVIGENGNCSYQVKHSVIFEITDIKVNTDSTSICRNDKSHHILAIESKNKVILTGDGVSQDKAGQYIFIGSNVPKEVDKVVIIANGKPTDLVITMQNAPFARFNYAIKGDDLILTNNSTDAEIYRWDISGEVIETESKDQIIRSVSKYNSGSITVSLTAMNKFCGEGIDGPKEIILREQVETNPCLETVSTFTKTAIEDIARIRLVRTFKSFSAETVSLVDQIENQLITVDQKTVAFINGEFNDQLAEMFTESIYGNLLLAIKNTELAAEKNVLSFLVENHISLFYYILKCQKADNLIKFKEPITAITDRFEILIKSFIEIKYNTDPKGTLTKFLSNIKASFKDTEYILEAIDRLLSNLG
ncbi:hypothetical protein SD960_08200 [Flavobacterium sp. MMLR14_040]|uniref:hypothetical protein n=1 Tax=Flavobacterium sp. MMLR14_040 TaxID=3093843 RepID=UPI00298FE473|nr:hypothetical protein [Flavobacterium sp. MMLR14_040]MDW8850068.1 hypothetical protein [Flavobacterium sp. MMLR14_040]